MAQKLFVGKFSQGDQLEKNYYRFGIEYEDRMEAHFGGLAEGDYVLPVQTAAVPKLFRFTGFDKDDTAFYARFDVVRNYTPALTLMGDVIGCKYFQPNMDLLNKAVKSTRWLGFVPIALEANCPDIADIDFPKSRRRFFICQSNKLADVSFFRAADICIAVSNDAAHEINDIVEFSGQSFARNEVLWNLYVDKTDGGKEKYALAELLLWADAQHDGAPKKEKYLKSVMEALGEEGIFAVDSPVAMYDNIIVGRRTSPPPKKEATGGSAAEAEPQEDGDADEIDPETLTSYQQYARLMAFNPNIILYGPPGTGKTYGAMRMIEAFERKNGGRGTFAQVVEEGRAKFITFHQAFSYEEFVEGIRPKIDDDGNMSYPVEPGVLREIADACRIQEQKKNLKSEALANTTAASHVWKVSLGQRDAVQIYKLLRDENVIGVNHSVHEDISDWEDVRIIDAEPSGGLRCLHSRVNIGDIVMVFNDQRTIRLLGVVTSDYFYDDSDNSGYNHRRKVQWLANFEDDPRDIVKMNGDKIMVQGSIYELRVSVPDAISLIPTEENKEATAKPYYLIIDEINRGNIAKIFGELITLIEKDKREALSCVLPYSRGSFTIPKNLYLIGTMNTSDRSIALLDTALRRRFAFIEINPDASIVEKEHITIGGNVNPAKLLQELNNRITERIDRDHRIGHSYFLGDDLVTKYDLFNVWYYKVLPLLMEYFYNDVKQVGEIVGAKFFDTRTGEIVHFSLKADANNVSEFENALISIYEREEQ